MTSPALSFGQKPGKKTCSMRPARTSMVRRFISRIPSISNLGDEGHRMV
jgi:hypothetical protein